VNIVGTAKRGEVIRRTKQKKTKVNREKNRGAPKGFFNGSVRNGQAGQGIAARREKFPAKNREIKRGGIFLQKKKNKNA